MSSEEYEVKLDTTNLKKLSQLFERQGAVGKIGVLQNTASRNEDDDVNNAIIAFWHEFGRGNNPVRSILRMPLIEHYQRKLDESGLDDESIQTAMDSGQGQELLEKVLIVGLATVLEAFDTGGFGQWPASDMRRKKNNQTLVETQQLRDSFTYEVSK